MKIPKTGKLEINNYSMRIVLKHVWGLFSFRDKVCSMLLYAVTFVGALFELVGIGFALPLIALLSDKNSMHNSRVLKFIYDTFAFDSERQLLVCMIFLFVIIILLKNGYLFFLLFIQTRYTKYIYSKVASRLFKAYIYSPYTYFLQKNSSTVLKNFQNVFNIIHGILMPLIMMISEITVTVIFLSFLLYMYFYYTIVICTILVLLMTIFYFYFRKKLYILGKTTDKYIEKLYLNLNHSLGSIKETKILGKEEYFVKSVTECLSSIGKMHSQHQLINNSFRYYIEIISILVVGLIFYFLYSENADTNKIIMTLSVYALVAIRLMPSVNRISTSLSNIKFCIPGFECIYNDLMDCEKRVCENHSYSTETIEFQKELKFNAVSFIYENNTKSTLNSVNLTIEKGSRIAFLGATGAGKTTIVDLLLGLLKPNSGNITVDGVDINSNLKAWQMHLGYIPQNIYLSDDTIRNNIAYGLDAGEIEDHKIWSSIENAQLSGFVKKLPQGLDTKIGERGIRISGGERQRIGIARALYNDPDVLVMDEATSALDNETEKAFICAIDNLRKNKTLIIIAHRLSTVKHCDVIYFIRDGMIKASGTFAELHKNCPDFRKLANLEVSHDELGMKDDLEYEKS